MSGREPLVLGLLTACLLSMPSAPPAAAADIHEEILIRGKAFGSLTSPSVEEAMRVLRQTAGGVDLVPAEAFRDRYALNLQDMLANTPGVFAKQRFAEEVRLSIRGSGLSRSFHMRGIKFLQDGMPLTLADNSTDFQEIDPATLRYVEVFKGANGLRYGAANLGGAINFVMPTGRTATAPAFVSLEGGSFETVRLHGHYAYAGEHSDAFVAATVSHSEGYRGHSTQNNRRAFGNVGFKLNDQAETRFYLAVNNINQDIPGALPLAAVFSDPKSVMPNIIAGDQARDIDSVRFSNKTTVALGSSTLTFSAFGTYKDLYHPIFQVFDQETVEYGASADIRTPFDLGAVPGAFVVGVNAGRGKTDAKRFVNVGGDRGALTSDVVQKASNLDAYAEARFEVAQGFHIIGGGQLIHTTRTYHDRLNPALSDDASYTSISPKAGILWEPEDRAQVFANISRSYEPPTFTELVQSPVPGFVPVRPQRAWTAEIGSRGHIAGLAWDIAVYRAWVRNEMLQFAVGGNIPAATFNAGKTIHQGIEAGLSATLLDGLVLRQTYMLSDFRFKNDGQFGDNRLAGIPKHLYRAELSYRHPSGFHITPSVDWALSRAAVDFANSLHVPRYAVANVSAGHDVSDKLSVYGEVRNIFDKRYVSNFGTLPDAAGSGAPDVFYPGEGFAVYFGIKWGFGA